MLRYNYTLLNQEMGPKMKHAAKKRRIIPASVVVAVLAFVGVLVLWSAPGMVFADESNSPEFAAVSDVSTAEVAGQQASEPVAEASPTEQVVPAESPHDGQASESVDNQPASANGESAAEMVEAKPEAQQSETQQPEAQQPDAQQPAADAQQPAPETQPLAQPEAVVVNPVETPSASEATGGGSTIVASLNSILSTVVGNSAALAKQPDSFGTPVKAPGESTAQGSSESAEQSAEVAQSSAQTPSASTIGAQSVTPVQPTHTFVFHAGDSVFDTIILKGDETLTQPASPSLDGKRFDGWYSNSACTTPFTGFGKPAPALDNGTTDVWAKFVDAYYFTYYDATGAVIQAEAVELGAEYTFNSLWPAFDTGYATDKNIGWRDAGGTVYADGQTITVTGNMELSPVIEEQGFTVRFHGQGGSATISQFLPVESLVTVPADPTWTGYAFAGWYDAPEGGNLFDFTAAPEVEVGDTVNLYAYWTPAETTYTLEFYVQDADDGDAYSYRTAYQKAGTTGTKAAIDTADKDFAKFKDKNGVAYYFEDHTDPATMPKIAADGSTVVRVYCNRVYYNLSFTSGSATIRWGQDMAQAVADLALGSFTYANGYSWKFSNGGTGFNLAYESDAATGSDAGSKLLSASRFYDPGTIREFTSKMFTSGTTFIVTLENFVGSSPNRYTFHYLYETVDSTPDNKQYAEIEQEYLYSGEYEVPVGSIKPNDPQFVFAQLNGAKNYNGNWQFVFIDGTPQPWYIYFDRMKYDVTFEENGGTIDAPDAIGVFYAAPLAGKEPAGYVVGQTTKMVDGVQYVFTGWFTDAVAKTGKVDFSTATMPGSNLKLYAGWETENHTVTFDANGGDLNGAASQALHYGSYAEEPDDPTREGDWKFVEWLGPDGEAYRFNTPVTADIVLTARWVSTANPYTIVYDAGEGEGSMMSEGSYVSGTTARAQSGASLVPPEGKHFVYWVDESGNRYYPGDLVVMSDSDVVLTAVFGPFDLAGFTYNFNYSAFGIASPCGYETYAGSDNLTNNTTVKLRSPLVSEVPDGYEFGGWYLTSDCSGDPIDEVIIDTSVTGLVLQATGAGSPSNVVYAKWVPKKETPETPNKKPSNNNSGNNSSNSGGNGGGTPYVPAVTPNSDIQPATESSEASTRAASGNYTQSHTSSTGDSLPVNALVILAAIAAVLVSVARPRVTKR